MLEISLKKRKEKKNVLRDIGQRANARNGRYPPESKKKKGLEKNVERGGQIRSREPLHEILMESLIQSSPNSFGQYLPTPGNQPLFSTPGDRVPSPLI